MPLAASSARTVGKSIAPALIRPRRLRSRALRVVRAGRALLARRPVRAVAVGALQPRAELPRRLRARHRAARAVDGRVQRGARLGRLDALEDHRGLAHRRADEAALAREGRRRALADDPGAARRRRPRARRSCGGCGPRRRPRCRGWRAPRRRRPRGPRTRSARRAPSPPRSSRRGRRRRRSTTGGLIISPSWARPSNGRPWASARKPEAVLWPKPREPKCTPIQTRSSSSSRNRST